MVAAGGGRGEEGRPPEKVEAGRPLEKGEAGRPPEKGEAGTPAGAAAAEVGSLAETGGCSAGHSSAAARRQEVGGQQLRPCRPCRPAGNSHEGSECREALQALVSCLHGMRRRLTVAIRQGVMVATRQGVMVATRQGVKVATRQGVAAGVENSCEQAACTGAWNPCSLSAAVPRAACHTRQGSTPWSLSQPVPSP